MAENYICKIASPEEMNAKWDYEIARCGEERENWIAWKRQHIENYKNGVSIPYYGVLNGTIICEATAVLRGDILQNGEGLAGGGTVYLCAFRTIAEYRGQGYFSKLFRFMIDDLRRRGYKKATLGVEPSESKNKAVYSHFGFTEFLRSGSERFPDGSLISVEYYAKTLN